MKKFWGFLLCFCFALACGTVALFSAGATRISIVKAETLPPFVNINPFAEGVTLHYTDNRAFDKAAPIALDEANYNAGKFTCRTVGTYQGIIGFKDEYQGFAGYKHPMATVTITVGLDTNYRIKTTGDGDEWGDDSWVELVYAQTWDDFENGEKIYSGAHNPLSTSNSLPSFQIKYNDLGIYRATIFTYKGTTDYVTTIYFIVKEKAPEFETWFFTKDNSYPTGEREWYKDKFTNKSRIVIGFYRVDGVIVGDMRFENIKNPDNGVPVFLDIEYDKDSETQQPIYDKVVLTKISGAKIKSGTDKITLSISYSTYDDMALDGTVVKAKNSQDVVVTLKFVDKAPKDKFPIWSLFLCAGILAALGLGFYGCNYVIRYTQTQNIVKQQKALERRAEIDRENIERMRESMAADENNRD